MENKKVDLDLKFEEFKKGFLDKFLDSHNFYNELEEAWQEYKNENLLINKTNNSKDNNEYPYGEEKDEESEGIHLGDGVKIQEGEIANRIYDTLLKNTDNPQFPFNEIEEQEIDCENNIISFRIGKSDFNIIVKEVFRGQ